MALTWDVQFWDSRDDVDKECLLECAVALLCLTRLDFDSLVKLGELKGEETRILAQKTTTNVLEPAWAILWQPESETLFVCVRGTTRLFQWAPHIAGAWGIAYPPAPSVTVHYIHPGMHRGAADLFPVLEAILTLGETPWRIVLTGHSYGGGVCAILALLIRDRFPDLNFHVLTFGAPRTITGDPRPTTIATPYYRLQHDGDIVTKLPPPLANIRGNILGQALGRVVGSLGGGPLLGLAIGQLGGPITSIGLWKHWGQGLQLGRDGFIAFADPPEDSALFLTSRKVGGGPIDNHVMDDAYWPSLRTSVRKGEGQPPSVQKILALGEEVLAKPIADDTEADWDAFDAQMQALTLQAWRLPPTVTVPQLREVEGVEIKLEVPSLKGSSTPMSSMARLTLHVQNTTYGKSITIGYNGASTVQAAWDQLLQWSRLHASLLGRRQGDRMAGGAANSEPIGLGSPVVEYGRVRDAQDPSIGKFDAVPAQFGLSDESPGTSVDNAADPLWNGIMTTLYASVAGPNGLIRRPMAYTVVGVPDRAFDGGRIKWATTYADPEGLGNNLGARFIALVKFLVAPGNNFGLIVRDPAELVKNIEGYTLQPEGTLRLSVTNHGYVTGDVIQVTRTKKTYCNRSWVVKFQDANTVELTGSNVAPGSVPKVLGKVQRIRDSKGKRLVKFAPFEAMTEDQIKNKAAYNRARKRSKRIVGVSFSRPAKFQR